MKRVEKKINKKLFILKFTTYVCILMYVKLMCIVVHRNNIFIIKPLTLFFYRGFLCEVIRAIV